MFRRLARFCPLALLLGITILLVACGSSSTTTVGPSSAPAALVSVSISPILAAVGTGGSAQFTATIRGSSNTAVTWSVNGVAGGNSSVGTISSTGVYTSPSAATAAVVTITATSQADSNKSASASAAVVTSKVTSTQNSQVAQYSFTSPMTAIVAIQFGTDTSYGLQTSGQSVPAGSTGNILVAGMRANTTYHMRAVAQLPGGTQYVDSDHIFTTGGLPASRLPNIAITVAAGPDTSGGIEMLDLVSLTPSNVISALAVDLQGNVIWYYDFSGIPNVGTDIPFPLKLLPNGHVKIVIGSPNPNPPVSEVQEIDLAGNLISELTTPELNTALANAGFSLTALGFHHDFAVLPNGHTVYLVMEERNVTFTGDTTPTLLIGDSLVDVDPSGKPVWTWSTFDHFDPNYHPFGFFPGCGQNGNAACDWTHSNALIYSPSDHDLIVSSRHLSWIWKIDYNDDAGTGNVLWRLGPGGDFSLTNGDSDWFYNQHYPNILSPNSSGNYNMAVWDNGNSRPNPITGIPCDGAPGGVGPCYSRGLILNVDEPSKTASIVWQDNLSPIFAVCCGNINVLSNGDVDMGAGGASLAPPGTEALEVTQTASPQVVWQMNVSGQFSYRIFRLPSLYPGVTW